MVKFCVQNVKVWIPGAVSLDTDLAKKIAGPTDFAVATGAASVLPYVWTATADSVGNVSVYYLGSHGTDAGFHPEAPGDRAGCVLPWISGPAIGSVNGAGRDSGRKFFTINGVVAHYPGRRVSDDFARQLSDAAKFGYIESVGEVRSDAIPTTIYTENIPMECRSNKVYPYGSDLFCRVECAYSAMNDADVGHFRDGVMIERGAEYWFLVEPIEVDHIMNYYNDGMQLGDVFAMKDILAACQFDPQDQFHARRFVRDQSIQTGDCAIGRFLNGEFIGDIAQISEKVVENRAKFAGAVEAEVASEGKKRGKFQKNDKVKIKCEGRLGIVRSVDGLKGLATLDVGGRRLVYRMADLERE